MLPINLAGLAVLGSVVYAQNNNGLTLLTNLVQKGSTVDGNSQIGADVKVQAKSLTSTNNFINNCQGKTLQNGLQITTGSCNGVTMGDIPAKGKMVSSIITNPITTNKAVFQANQDFSVTVQMSNLQAGSFTNAAATYYSAPQGLNNGIVVGHTHITIQDMGNNMNPTTAPDPEKFAFFKGINDAGNGKGLLTATVAGGLPAGNYRVCTMASASNHQPVLMPVAQRGTSDDCTKFIVGGNGGTKNVAANDGTSGLANIALQNSAIALGAGAIDTATAAATKAAATSAAKGGKAAATTAAAAAKNTANANANNGGNNGKGRNGQKTRQRVRRVFVS